MPDEWQIEEHFDERFIKYINTISKQARSLNKNYNNDLRRILYRVEKDRLSYDSIVNL